jgi:succinate-semialdehyde dehydrogenase/glutarate-semialdehyde dehydrogenase
MLKSNLLPEWAAYIDGKWVTKGAGEAAVLNPANGDLLAQVPQLETSQVEEAIRAADRACRAGTDLATRKGWLLSLRDALLEHREELGRIITLEHGKPHPEAIVEVEYSAGFFDYYGYCIDKLEPELLETQSRGCAWTIHHRPAGVAASITPWNFPLAMFAKKLAPALAAGCGVVARPSGETPLTAIAVYTIADRIGLPPGQMNLAIGKAGPIGELFCAHPLVRVISCTSSTETGRILLRNAANHIKRLSLELGGNAPFIVCDDADLEAAADGFMANKFRGAGQTCVCSNRVYAHESISKEFLSLLADRIGKLRMGNGMAPGTDIGPLINRSAFDKVASHLSDALERGAVKVCGEEPVRPSENWGAFFPPTLVSNATDEMKVFREETFGPLVAVAEFKSEEEVIERSNATEFGLAAYVYSGDKKRGHRIVDELRFGHVGLNTGTGPTPEAPFGGFKQSGFGREGGLEGLFEFVEPQTVTTPR